MNSRNHFCGWNSVLWCWGVCECECDKGPVIHLGLVMYSTTHVNSLICLVIFLTYEARKVFLHYCLLRNLSVFELNLCLRFYSFMINCTNPYARLL